ncbi:uncharacterized protein LOC141597280 [Silene latifolia]|uniref:uncharacterized protein LOC141597280 n=1 Tax=Silene latifolia TaxID=37657 RepID=UPI003D76F5B6
METQGSSNTQIITKKVWNIFQILYAMVKRGISKSKLIVDLNLLLKRGNALAGRAIHGLVIHHNALICKSNNLNNHFISPKEYEFSCSNSPELGPFQVIMAHQKKSSWLKPNHKRYRYNLEDPTTVAAVQRVLEMLNSNEGPTASPLGVGVGVAGQGQYSSLPGFGSDKSPLTRQLRVTDSPFPLKDGKGNDEEQEEDVKVNKAADDFIKRFYKNLKMQKSLESPCHIWAR